MILVDQQNFTINLTTELLTYIVSGLQTVAWWAKALQLNQKVLCLNSTPTALPGLATERFDNALGEPQVKT